MHILKMNLAGMALVFALLVTLLGGCAPRDNNTPATATTAASVEAGVGTPATSPLRPGSPTSPLTTPSVRPATSAVATPATSICTTDLGRFADASLPARPPSDLLLAALTTGEAMIVSRNQIATPDQGMAATYDPKTNTWMLVGLPPFPWEYDWLAPLPGGAALLGDLTTDGLHFWTARYEPATRRFGERVPVVLPGALPQFYAAAAVALSGGDLLIAGTKQAWRYNPERGTVAPTGPKRTDAYDKLLTLSDGRVLALGGLGPGRAPDLPNPTGVAELYDPARDEWRALPDLPQGARHEYALVALPDGRALVAGGVTAPPPGQALARTDIYDPASNAWVPGPPLPTPLVAPGAVALSDGSVLVTGGRSDASSDVDYRTAAYRYLPGDDRWRDTGQLRAGRSNLYAQRLADGRALLVGGQFRTANTITSELYTPPCWP